MEYLTVKGYAQAEFVQKRSQFIGVIYPVKTEEEAISFINGKRSEHSAAAHNVFAYVLRCGLVRCSDDGEPQGTGGVPVLSCIQKSRLVNVVVVVTRYFGGILLGAGGLVRAYGHGASIAIEASQLLKMSVCSRFKLQLDYSFYGKLTYIIPDFYIEVQETDFQDKVIMTLIINNINLNNFKNALTELSSGTVEMEMIEEIMYNL